MHPQKCLVSLCKGWDAFHETPLASVVDSTGTPLQIPATTWPSQLKELILAGGAEADSIVYLLGYLLGMSSRGGDVTAYTAYQGDMRTDPRWCREGPRSFVKTDPFICDRGGRRLSCLPVSTSWRRFTMSALSEHPWQEWNFLTPLSCRLINAGAN